MSATKRGSRARSSRPSGGDKVFKVVEYKINPYTGRMNKIARGEFKDEANAHSRWQQMKALGLNVGVEKR